MPHVKLLRDTVEKVRRRFEDGKIDAKKALEELSQMEEKALRAALQLMLFPWATAGAIRELYGRVREQDETIRRLEDRIRQLERERSAGPS
jgi:hypothetical protein